MWEKVIGQDRAVALLQRAATRPAHAYILVGPRGSGVDDAARCFAAALVAPDGDERAARLALRSMPPDVVEIEPEKTVISVEQAHDLTREAARAPVEADRKVIILLEAHRRSHEAANAILKTLEEPPPHAHFILVTEAPDELLETVRSRCQRVDLDPLSAHTITAAPAQLDGSPATALRLADELSAAVQDALAARKREHEAEAEELDREIEARGYPDRAATRLRRKLAERHGRHERFERRLLLDEGFTALESVYRDALVSPGPPLNSDRAPISVSPSAAARAVDLCRDAREAM